jgi:hypothetical protein
LGTADLALPARYSSNSSRTLLHDWLTAEGAVAGEIELELISRGFRPRSRQFVEVLLHGAASERTRIVYELLRLPVREAKAWLVLMAEDEHAEVRLGAITVMATSSDSELRNRAWNLAVHDRDPRVAAFAERIRE